MRVCPKCNRSYTDETLFFCTDDGTQLVAAGPPPAYQQPVPQPPRPAPQQQQYYQQPQAAPQMSFGQQPARKSKALAKTAMILGIVSASLFIVAIIRLWYYWGIISHYNWGGRDHLFWAMSGTALLFIVIALPLALVAIIMSFKNPARYGGKLHAVAGTFPAVVLGVIALGGFAYARVKAAASNAYDSYNYTYNSNSSSSNSNYSYNSNSTSNYNSSSSSSGTMSEDDKYRLFYAASKTGDQKLMMQAAQKIGLLDKSGRPTSDYQSFLRNSITWAFKDTEFTNSIDTPEKARAYVMAHL